MFMESYVQRIQKFNQIMLIRLQNNEEIASAFIRYRHLACLVARFFSLFLKEAGPPHFLKSEVFFKKLIAFNLSNDKKGEVTSEKNYQRDVIRKSINTDSL